MKLKITVIDYDEGIKYTSEKEIAPWNISGAWKCNEKFYVVSMIGEEPFYVEKQDYEKVIKYIHKKERG